MSVYAHQQVFSTGAWWDFEEIAPGLYRRSYMLTDPHYFHPAGCDPSVCAKCGDGPHGLAPGRPEELRVEEPAVGPAEPSRNLNVLHGVPSVPSSVPIPRQTALEYAGNAGGVLAEGEFYTTPVCVRTREQALVLDVFVRLLRDATADGGRKRAAGIKPPWWRDAGHRAAIFSHLSKYERGEKRDKDSGSHPYVHLAWRALAVAYQERYGLREPDANTGGC